MAIIAPYKPGASSVLDLKPTKIIKIDKNYTVSSYTELTASKLGIDSSQIKKILYVFDAQKNDNTEDVYLIASGQGTAYIILKISNSNPNQLKSVILNSDLVSPGYSSQNFAKEPVTFLDGKSQRLFAATGGGNASNSYKPGKLHEIDLLTLTLKKSIELLPGAESPQWIFVDNEQAFVYTIATFDRTFRSAPSGFLTQIDLNNWTVKGSVADVTPAPIQDSYGNVPHPISLEKPIVDGNNLFTLKHGAVYVPKGGYNNPIIPELLQFNISNKIEQKKSIFFTPVICNGLDNVALNKTICREYQKPELITFDRGSHKAYYLLSNAATKGFVNVLDTSKENSISPIKYEDYETLYNSGESCQCPEGKKACHGGCFSCCNNTDCPTGNVCDKYYPFECIGCNENSDCAKGICDKNTKTCVECKYDDSCPTGSHCFEKLCYKESVKLESVLPKTVAIGATIKVKGQGFTKTSLFKIKNSDNDVKSNNFLFDLKTISINDSGTEALLQIPQISSDDLVSNQSLLRHYFYLYAIEPSLKTGSNRILIKMNSDGCATNEECGVDKICKNKSCVDSPNSKNPTLYANDPFFAYSKSVNLFGENLSSINKASVITYETVTINGVSSSKEVLLPTTFKLISDNEISFVIPESLDFSNQYVYYKILFESPNGRSIQRSFRYINQSNCPAGQKMCPNKDASNWQCQACCDKNDCSNGLACVNEKCESGILCGAGQIACGSTCCNISTQECKENKCVDKPVEPECSSSKPCPVGKTCTSQGKCEDVLCTSEYEPVCCNKKEFSNACEAKKEGYTESNCT